MTKEQVVLNFCSTTCSLIHSTFALQILKNRYGQRKVEDDTIEMIFQPATYTHTLVDLSIGPVSSSSK